MAITLDGSTGITTPTYSGSVSAEYITPVTGFKNRIINGDMKIDQRNAGAEVTSGTSQYTVDRFDLSESATSVVSFQQNAGSVTPPTGFTNYIGFTTTTSSSPSSSQYTLFRQRIEGYNIADLGWGTAAAKSVTLSFWVRSSLTGTFGGSFRNSANNRSYPFSYTISSANTWEQKSITIAGDTTGTWLTTNGTGITITFSLGSGSDYLSTANSWQAGNYQGVTGQTNVVETNSATWQITGVQLEKGDTATSFDYRPYGTELALCQRYYQTSYPMGVAINSQTGPTEGASFICINTSDTSNGGLLPVTMRATPTFAMYSTIGSAGSPSARSNVSGAIVTGITLVEGTTTSLPRLNKTGGLSATGSPYSAHYTASAEL